MYKICTTLLILLVLIFPAQAQKDSLSKADKAALDSMLKNDEFVKMFQEKDKNSFEVSVGMGNGSFSTKNRAVNASGMVNLLVFNPSLVYRLKSGFSFGVTGFLVSDSGKLDLYQTGVNAAYDYDGDKVKTGISYTRYLSDMKKYNSKSLYQNDVYAYVKKASGALQPGLSLGFSSGKFKEIDIIKIKRPIVGDTIRVKDSTDNTSRYFSVSASVEHDFYFYKLFDKGDEFDFVPALILNAGIEKGTSVTTNKLYQLLMSKRKSQRQRNEPSNKFELQSIALSLDGTYGIGKFFLQTNLYFDYYLPSTTTKRLNAFYTITAGLSF